MLCMYIPLNHLSIHVSTNLLSIVYPCSYIIYCLSIHWSSVCHLFFCARQHPCSGFDTDPDTVVEGELKSLWLFPWPQSRTMRLLVPAEPRGERHDSNDCKFKIGKCHFLRCGYTIVEHNWEFRKTFFSV